MLDPGSGESFGDIYWYGDAFARQGYVVLALDIEHRPQKDSEPLYGNGADYRGPKADLHAEIKADGFDSDWVEDGERAWDAMRAVDCLLAQSNVDPHKILVTGLSMGGEISTVVAALDPRLAGCIPASFSPDLDVLYYRPHKNHTCWRWMHADIREYIDTADLHALIAPRLLIVQTGMQDTTYSSFTFQGKAYPFASDKQVARRSRVAYSRECRRFIHYLHPDKHFYHVGGFDPSHPNAEQGVQIPKLTDPDPTQTEPCPDTTFSPTWLIDPASWQIDSTTQELSPTLFALLDTYL